MTRSVKQGVTSGGAAPGFISLVLQKIKLGADRSAGPGHYESGQMLVALLSFVAMGVTLTSAAVMITIANTQTASKYSLGQDALAVAESGADNALLRLTRDPTYTGETLTVGTGTATITVSGSTTKTITSVGLSGTFRRTIVVTASQTSNVLTVTSWVETP